MQQLPAYADDYLHVIPEIIERVNARVDPFPIFGADETRSFCGIDDAVEAIQGVMESGVTDGKTYHIGTRSETSIKELIEMIFNIMNWHPRQVDIKKSPEGSVRRRLPDVSKIKKDINWEAKTELEDGLRNMVKWYNENPKPKTGVMK